ncbi:MAG: hypothetical protein HY908_23270 [Myxococcales bacterium]|nr:hypothetical protein [Myxococcales bacterium]
MTASIAPRAASCERANRMPLQWWGQGPVRAAADGKWTLCAPNRGPLWRAAASAAVACGARAIHLVAW